MTNILASPPLFISICCMWSYASFTNSSLYQSVNINRRSLYFQIEEFMKGM